MESKALKVLATGIATVGLAAFGVAGYGIWVGTALCYQVAAIEAMAGVASAVVAAVIWFESATY